MTKQPNLSRIMVILLFALTFMSIGWMAPALHASYAPNDSIIEAHDFTASNATTDSDEHYICFDRTVQYEATGTAFTELYLVNDGDKRLRTEVDSQTVDRYFQHGRSEVVTPIELPDDLPEGEYRYVLVVRMDLADGRVERAFTFESETFYISDNVTNEGRAGAC